MYLQVITIKETGTFEHSPEDEWKVDRTCRQRNDHFCDHSVRRKRRCWTKPKISDDDNYIEDILRYLKIYLKVMTRI